MNYSIIFIHIKIKLIMNIYYFFDIIILYKIYIIISNKVYGDWGLGIGDWGLGPIPNPQSPIPNPQSPIPNINNILLIEYF